MIKKTFHILVIAILALNLMGALAFASALDCGMECCNTGDWAGTPSYEAASCCDLNNVTCSFETGQYQELFDNAICCFNSADNDQSTANELISVATIDTLTHSPNYAYTFQKTTPSQGTPIYLSNAVFLC